MYAQLNIHGMMHSAQTTCTEGTGTGDKMAGRVTVLLPFSLLQGNLCLKWNRALHLMKMVTLTRSNYWRVVWKKPVRLCMLSFSDRRTWAQPNNLEIAHFNTDTNVQCRHLNIKIVGETVGHYTSEFMQLVCNLRTGTLVEQWEREAIL